ncbi:hypothetical protein X767_17900 [Mesorhizobium sp. LSJC264A00]|nr:hypothetical protein X767_17900 [Mesorhizobium sp. LSJC264A00]
MWDTPSIMVGMTPQSTRSVMASGDSMMGVVMAISFKKVLSGT